MGPLLWLFSCIQARSQGRGCLGATWKKDGSFKLFCGLKLVLVTKIWKNPIKSPYLSADIQILNHSDIMFWYRQKVIDRINNAEYFSILGDGTMDVCTEQLSLCRHCALERWHEWSLNSRTLRRFYRICPKWQSIFWKFDESTAASWSEDVETCRARV